MIHEAEHPLIYKKAQLVDEIWQIKIYDNLYIINIYIV